ncbi:MAG: EAL domain-containing protein, partial [Gammaproteobacteria bacterium]
SDHPKVQDLHLFINLSGQSLCDMNFLDFICQEFQASNISPRRFTFEITETAVIANFSRAVKFINTLKALGCQFALDDFGSGLSSFAYLKNLPVNYLKIDGTFVRSITSDSTDAAFIQAIHQIGNIMGIDTIAEYVESEEILEKVRDMGISFAQGFYLDKPRPLAEFFAAEK